MINKKGLSDIIATVLIVLLALAAIAIVWAFVSPTIRSGGEQIDATRRCFDAEVAVTSCDATLDTVTFRINKGPEFVKKVRAIVEDSDGQVITNTADVPAGSALFYSSTVGVTGITSGDDAQVVVEVDNGNGGVLTCEIRSSKVTCAT